MKLEVGKSYKMRDGRKAVVLKYIEQQIYSFEGEIEGQECRLNWDRSGFWSDENHLDSLDLIAPWEEKTIAVSVPMETINAMQSAWGMDKLKENYSELLTAFKEFHSSSKFHYTGMTGDMEEEWIDAKKVIEKAEKIIAEQK